jgi:hypothetical protein
LIFQSILLPGILIPALVTTLTLGLFALLRESPARGATGGSIAAGFVAAFVAISGWPRWPPVEATQRLCFLAGALVLLALLLAGTRNRWVRTGLRLSVAAAMVWLLLQSPIQHTWTPLASIVWIGSLTLWLLLLGWAFGACFKRELASGGLGAVLVRLTVVGGVAVSLGLSESFRLGQITGAVGCSMAVVETAVWISPRWHWARSDGTVIATILGGMMIVGYFFSGLQAWPAALLSLSILLLAQPGREKNWQLLLPMVPLAIALTLVVAGYLAKADDPYGDYYSFHDLSRVEETEPHHRPGLEARKRMRSPGSPAEAESPTEGPDPSVQLLPATEVPDRGRSRYIAGLSDEQSA